MKEKKTIKKNNKIQKITRVAILTSGGDSSGMNSAIRAITKAAYWKGIEPYLVYNGYKGLYDGDIWPASNINIDHYFNEGGTFIHTSRFPEFKDPKVRAAAKKQLDKKGIEALVVIGGDGSYHGAQLLHKIGVKTITLPGTIDNDISSSDYTIGFLTALESIVENIDRIRDTANSHHRCVIVEVMGRYAGDLALYSGIASGAELIITNEKVPTVNEMAKIVDYQINKLKKESIIIITSEHIFKDLKSIASEIEKKSKVETREIILGHLQRGGTPTGMERFLAAQMGTYAIELLCQGKSGLAIGIVDNKLKAEEILKSLSKPRPKYFDLIKKYSDINQK